MKLEAVIFDLDGVLVSTDEFHYQAWKKLADQNSIYFDRLINEELRGVSRMESLEILLRRAVRKYSKEEKEQMAGFKNQEYTALLAHLTPDDVLPGVMDLLAELETGQIKKAVASSSKNARIILERIGLDKAFDTVVDGTMIVNSKPDPEVFLKAAKLMGIEPVSCVVVEDACSGVDGALAAGMKVVGVYSAKNHPGVDVGCGQISELSVDKLMKID